MYSYNARIRYSETDTSGRLSPMALLDYFQDTAIFHSEDAGIGLDFMAANSLVWVLSSWQIDIGKMPRTGSNVIVSTFPYEFKGFVGYRNFLLKSAEGENLAVANSVWSLLNTVSGKPEMVTKEIADAFGSGEKLDMEYAGKKLRAPREVCGSDMGKITVCPQHLDTNKHVNNGQYVHMALDYIPQELIAKGRVTRIRAEYKRQAVLGDELIPVMYHYEDKVLVVLNGPDGKPVTNVEFTIGVF